jgi:hypothetical protein
VIWWEILKMLDVAASGANVCIHMGDARRCTLEDVEPLKVQAMDYESFQAA